MELVNEFTVPAPVDQAWGLLTDVSRIGPCLPGATVEPIGDDRYAGAVSVKVGPIKVAYTGEAAFRSLDADARRMVLDARGTERTGKGAASAVITVDLRPADDTSTAVHVLTDLQVTGKIAQFGRSAMRDVSGRLLDQFADNLAGLLTSGGTGHASTTSSSPARKDAPLAGEPARTSPTAPAAGELNALALLAGPARRAAVPAAAFLAGTLVGALLRIGRGAPRAATRAALHGCGCS